MLTLRFFQARTWNLFAAGLLVFAAGIGTWYYLSRVNPPRQFQEIHVGNVALMVEIPNTPERVQRGLMFRERLSDKEGMLFVFGKPRRHAFWMKNTLIDLDIGFFDQHGKLMEIQHMTANQTVERYRPERDARYALEVSAGWFARQGITPGADLIVAR